MHVQQALTRSLAEARKRQAQMLLLLDTAAAENSHLTLDRWQIPYWSLFEGTPEERLLEIAPLLIAVSDLEDWAAGLQDSQPQHAAFACSVVELAERADLRGLALLLDRAASAGPVGAAGADRTAGQGVTP